MKKCLAVLLCTGLLTMILSGCGDILPGDSTLPDDSSREDPVSAVGQETPEASDAENDISDTVETDDSAAYYGTWKVIDFQSAEFTALSTDDMESYRGVSITYQPDSVLLDGENVTSDSFTFKTDDTALNYDSLTEAYGANLGEWWNNINEVIQITVDSDESFFGDQFFVVDADTIWIYYEGVFFLAKNFDR